MTKIILSLIGISVSCIVQSQRLSPSVISSAGGTGRAGGIALEWTLGEANVGNITASNNIYTQGFNQPYLQIKKLSKPSPEWQGLQVSVMPNPVQSVLFVKIVSDKNERLAISLLDYTGRIIKSIQPTGRYINQAVDMSGVIAGLYLLEVRNATGGLVKSFKVLKGN